MAKVYIGNLPANVKEREVEDLFYKFGRIRMIDIKGQGRGPCFGFVEYEDPRDAEEAVRRRDGVDFYGYRIRVEIARGGTGRASESFRPPRSAGWRVIVKGLPHTASWQDLKDFIRKACTPMFVDVVKDRDGNSQGVVEFESEGDMRLALRKLDDTEFRNPRYDAGCYLRLIEESASSRRDDRAAPAPGPRAAAAGAAAAPWTATGAATASVTRATAAAALAVAQVALLGTTMTAVRHPHVTAAAAAAGTALLTGSALLRSEGKVMACAVAV
eukprot:CAMPEP_0202869442 /NCGR_PEP_ID=MMETSP1391-20130828/12454_1 /ASSEMBLY_ACC=CAM_ASM_000867 /TAXON_ID=1034604 /ORGANISM="Chlamydomonas leiostraca, Strain SAG 11-49" /LENGTH=271 /DNA_ID=CAMNT_0049549757 /DNA_START=80 /DNA_END=896 /DNA_ORIENTATION=+